MTSDCEQEGKIGKGGKKILKKKIIVDECKKE